MESFLTSCTLCPRQCHADRTKGTGFCGGGKHVRLARAALHFWEEPCISGTRGSGTVFFSGCPLQCCFCQNYSISCGNFGEEVSVERLSQIFLELQSQGAHNINLVSAAQYVPWVVRALELCGKGLEIPVVYNSGGYESVETLRRLEGKVDIYLPDLKYKDSDRSLRYSRAADYFAVASQAIREMVRQTGPVQMDDQGILRKGVIIRHLVMPGGMEDSKRVLEWISQTFAPGEILISLMSQYTPFYRSEEFPEINRRISTYEYHKVSEYMQDLGLTQGFMQERSSAKEEYTPSFALQGVFAPAWEEKRK